MFLIYFINDMFVNTTISVTGRSVSARLLLSANKIKRGTDGQTCVATKKKKNRDLL